MSLMGASVSRAGGASTTTTTSESLTSRTSSIGSPPARQRFGLTCRSRVAGAGEAGSAHNPFHHPVDRAALLHLPLHAPWVDPVEELVGIRSDLLGNVVLAEEVNAEASFRVRLLLK